MASRFRLSARLIHASVAISSLSGAPAVRALRVEERFLAPAIKGKTEREVLRNDEVEEALRAAAEGKPDEAWARLLEAARHSPGNGGAALAL
jgi:hypothetical protein